MTSRTETRPNSVVPDQAAKNARRSLHVVEVKPGLHERAEGISDQPVYHIFWRREPVRLFGRWRIPGMGKGSGRFVRLSPDKIAMPDEAARRYHQAYYASDMDAMAVFLSTQLRDSRVELILAGHNKGRWLELYRWTASWRELGLSRLDICSF